MPTVSYLPRATCQCCFGEQALSDGAIVLHGYQRPGNGYVHGRCRGTAHPPFELDSQVTRSYLAWCQEELPEAQLRAKELTAELEKIPFAQHHRRIPAVRECEQARQYVRWLEHDIAALTERLKGWRKRPERIIPAGQREAEAAAATAARKAERDRTRAATAARKAAYEARMCWRLAYTAPSGYRETGLGKDARKYSERSAAKAVKEYQSYPGYTDVRMFRTTPTK